ALQDGKDLLDQGCVSHNYFEYYTEAMELMLDSECWADVEGYAAALEQFVSQEPLPRTIYIIARARALASFGAGDKTSARMSELEKLQEQAGTVGLLASKRKLDLAVSI
ncbi:MAG: hypothetical protein AAGH60_15740, partial [Pseudomonadota bacterium]